MAWVLVSAWWWSRGFAVGLTWVLGFGSRRGGGSWVLGVRIFWWLGFSGLGLSGWVDGGLGSRGWDFLVGLTVAWVLGVGIFWWRWVDGGLGFGLGVVVEPWVCRGFGSCSL